MLASDVANPEYVNPQNPDAGLQVEFFIWKRPDPVNREGLKMSSDEGKTFVRIEKPGDKTLMVEERAHDGHKQRFPRQWQHFQTSQGEGLVIGTPLEAWFEARPGDLTEQQLWELKIVKFTSCEQLAVATDAQIQRLPLGTQSLKVKVSEWLASQTKSHASQELEAVKSQLLDSRRQMDEMNALLSEMVAARKGGRPRKNPIVKPTGVKAHGQHAPATGDAGNL